MENIASIDISVTPDIYKTDTPGHYDRFCIDFQPESVPTVASFESLGDAKRWLVSTFGMEQFRIWFPGGISEEEIRETILQECQQFSGGHYDEITLGSKFLTSLAWNLHPSDAYDNLIARISERYPDYNDIEINYFVLIADDKFCATNETVKAEIAVDLEEWDVKIPEIQRHWNQDTEVNSFILNCLDEFADSLVKDIEDYLNKKYGLYPYELIAIIADMA